MTGSHSPMLSEDDATRAIQTVQDLLRSRGQSAAVAVVDAHGELIGFLRIGSPTLACLQISMNKAFTAARERSTTKEIGEASRTQGFDIAYYGDSRYVGWAGGVPVLRNKTVVGGIGVSGLEELEDEALALAAAEAIGTR